ncbi:MAG: 50S ribosomal protein L29 [Sphingobacteriales bacterium JAD_PAG50586_3]|nr:MAG: 50S ribosomal protein L29 [Sphingobacteriales bacterium JAD_PAG50586_3]
MKQEIVKDLTTAEVKDRLATERETLTRLKLSHAVSPVENPMTIRYSRKAIARLETELRKRQLAETKA